MSIWKWDYIDMIKRPHWRYKKQRLFSVSSSKNSSTKTTVHSPYQPPILSFEMKACSFMNFRWTACLTTMQFFTGTLTAVVALVLATVVMGAPLPEPSNVYVVAVFNWSSHPNAGFVCRDWWTVTRQRSRRYTIVSEHCRNKNTIILVVFEFKKISIVTRSHKDYISTYTLFGHSQSYRNKYYIAYILQTLTHVVLVAVFSEIPRLCDGSKFRKYFGICWSYNAYQRSLVVRNNVMDRCMAGKVTGNNCYDLQLVDMAILFFKALAVRRNTAH